MKELLELRRKLKKKKPKFLRQDAHRVKKLAKKWRKPKGRHSKMRFKLRSYRKQPSIGYSSPRKVRGLDSKGRIEVIVNNIQGLDKIKQNEVIVIGSTVGTKKKVQILKKIQEKKLTVKNVKDIEAFMKEVEERLKKKKEESKQKETKKEKSKEEVRCTTTANQKEGAQCDASKTTEREEQR